MSRYLFKHEPFFNDSSVVLNQDGDFWIDMGGDGRLYLRRLYTDARLLLTEDWEGAAFEARKNEETLDGTPMVEYFIRKFSYTFDDDAE